MATLRAFRACDMRIIIRAEDDPGPSDDIEIPDGVWRTTFSGDFQKTATGYTGSVTGFAQTHDGRRVFEATGVDRPAADCFAFIDARDNDGFLAYTLAGADRILGSGRGDHLIGFGGGDTLRGRGGDDALFGGAGHDSIEGGAGNDFLAGGGKDDRLDGGFGRDTLRGGGGDDLFRFRDARAADGDRIRDLGDGRDRIDLSEIDAAPRRGNQGFDWIGDDAFSGRAGELRYDNGRLTGDLDGDGGADFTVRLDPDVDLSRADLIL